MRGRHDFEAASKAMRARVEGTADIQEVRVFGDWAYCWNQLTVTIRPDGGSELNRLSGPALSIFRKKPDGQWVIYRDANMVSPAK